MKLSCDRNRFAKRLFKRSEARTPPQFANLDPRDCHVVRVVLTPGRIPPNDFGSPLRYTNSELQVGYMNFYGCKDGSSAKGLGKDSVCYLAVLSMVLGLSDDRHRGKQMSDAVPASPQSQDLQQLSSITPGLWVLGLEVLQEKHVSSEPMQKEKQGACDLSRCLELGWNVVVASAYMDIIMP
jgi:hypothetical protein